MSTARTARPVRVGLQLLDAERRLIDRDYARHPLPADVSPGDACVMPVSFAAPDAPGRYAVKVDLVAEGVTWFETSGTIPAIHSLIVRQ